MITIKNPYIHSTYILLLLSAPLLLLLYIDFLYFHTLVEAYTIAIGITIFVITINSRQYFTNSFFIIFGVSFFAVGFIDFVHSLAYEGMNFKNLSSSNTASQLWILSRYIQSLSVLASLLFANRTVRLFPLSVFYGVITFIGIGLILTGLFPTAYIVGKGQSLFKVLSEFVVIALFLTSFFLIKRLRSIFDTYTFEMLRTGLIFAALAEVMFASYVSVFSLVNATGHFLKMFAFYFFYRACIYMSLNKPLESIFIKLNDHQRFLHNIIESLSYPFYVIDTKDYSIRLANSATKLYSGQTTCHSAIHNSPTPCSPKDHPCPLDIVKKTKAPAIVEHIHTDERGQDRIVEVHAYPILGKDGEVEQVIEYCFDITDKKRERELIKKLSLAIEQSSNSIFITDSEGNIEYVNSTFTEVTGYSADEVIGKKPSMFKSGVTPPEVYEDLWRTIKSGKVWRGQLCNKKKNGDLFWEAVTISPLKNDQGETTHFVAVREDIQDKIRAEVAEEKAKEQEKRVFELERELQLLDHLIRLHQPTITARAYGQIPFKESMPELFEEFVLLYVDLLDRYIDAQIYREDSNKITEDLKDFTERIGMLKMGPRDLIDIHTAALRLRTTDRKNQRGLAYKEEGRMMVLELMGYLVNYYRNYFIMTTKTH